jgi:hypothetical protein
LHGKSDKQVVEAIGEAYLEISQVYSPFNVSFLPVYLPAQQPLQVEELQVWKKLGKMKKTKSTFLIDLLERLCKEFAVELSTPLTNIINCCLTQGLFPTIWKE